MATLIYALNGGGRGHLSRALAISETLRRRGHEVIFCCGGAKAVLEKHGEIIEVPALEQVIYNNRGSFAQTVRRNLKPFALGFDVPRLVDALQTYKPDLLISDFEPFATLAAELMRLPTVALNRQQVVTEARYALPYKFRASAFLTRAAVRYLAPKNPERILLPTFSPLELKHPQRATPIAPIVRDSVKRQTPRQGEHLLVYYNHEDSAALLEVLAQIKHTFVVYRSSPVTSPVPANVLLKHPSAGTFEEDLAACRGVLCTAGFNLISEALFLGKPLLVHPNRRFFEQTLNALLLERHALGHACFGRTLSRTAIETFIARLPDLKPHSFEPGNEAACAAIERLCARSTECARPPLPRKEPSSV